MLLTILALGPSDITLRAMLNINPLLATLHRTPTMHITPPIRRSRLDTILHPTNMCATMLRLALPPHITPIGLARMLCAK